MSTSDATLADATAAAAPTSRATIALPQPDLVIYHHNCADGFGAAWVFHHHHRRTVMGRPYPEFVPGRYGHPPPDVTGRDVYLVDFSFKAEVVQHMLATARSVTLIDHHKTALEELEPLRAQGLRMFVDLNRSGATLAWDYLFPGQPRPLLLGHIEDRDLWRFKLAHTREIQSAVFSLPYSFDTWDRLMAAAPHDLVELTAQGAAIERKHTKDVAELVATTRRYMHIGCMVVPAANLPYTMASDAGHLLAHEMPAAFAAVYWDTPEHRQFSLRSLAGGMDVSRIAQGYGGGGHEHAAGFRVLRDHPLAQA